jgi:hypothetical protein
MDQLACRNCGAPFAAWRAKRFCSERCAGAARQRARRRRLAALHPNPWDAFELKTWEELIAPPAPPPTGPST